MTALPDYADALARALHGVAAIVRTEYVPLHQASGRILAQDVKADRDLPPFDRAQMDGYAVRSSEVVRDRAFAVVGTIAAGMAASVVVPPEECVAIATGAPLPGDVDAVIPHEQSDRGDRMESGRPVKFSVDSIAAGHAVHARGSDAHAGDVVIAAGTQLAAHHLGIAAAVGAADVPVRARPQAIVLTSGDEVVAVDSEVEPHQIRNSNGPMTAELLHRFGAEMIGARHLPDDREATMKAFRDAVNLAEIVITVGGVSAGDRDHFPAAFDSCKVKRHLQGAAIQPGRPVLVGMTPDGTVVVGLPGNPVSALVCSCLFIWPVVRAMLGLDSTLPWRDVVLAEAVKPNASRRAFRPAIMGDDGGVVVPSWAGSGDLVHVSPTHGVVELPVQGEPVPEGTSLRFLPWP
jgi:molybdopterin molybdotransferase